MELEHTILRLYGAERDGKVRLCDVRLRVEEVFGLRVDAVAVEEAARKLGLRVSDGFVHGLAPLMGLPRRYALWPSWKPVKLWTMRRLVDEDFSSAEKVMDFVTRHICLDAEQKSVVRYFVEAQAVTGEAAILIRGERACGKTALAKVLWYVYPDALMVDPGDRLHIDTLRSVTEELLGMRALIVTTRQMEPQPESYLTFCVDMKDLGIHEYGPWALEYAKFESGR